MSYVTFDSIGVSTDLPQTMLNLQVPINTNKNIRYINVFSRNASVINHN